MPTTIPISRAGAAKRAMLARHALSQIKIIA
jgi:hypothetical protein